MTRDRPVHRVVGRASLACEWWRVGPARPGAAPARDGDEVSFGKTGITVGAAASVLSSSVLEHVVDLDQPDWFTFRYRMLRLLGNRGIGRVLPGIRGRAWRRYGARLVEMVRLSIEATRDGGNLFVVARRPRAS